MPNVLKITVENSEELVNAGAYDTGALIQLQSSSAETQDGTFADIAGTGSTPTLALVSGTRTYTGYDPNGTSLTWYRTRYKNAAATRTSDWSASFQVGGESAGQLCSIYDTKQRLGILATDTTADEDLLSFIDQTTTDIQGYTKRLFARSPGTGTTTFLFNVPTAVRTFHIAKGIASLTAVEVAPYTNAAYVVVPTTDWYADPPSAERDDGWPATKITISDYPTGGVYYFYPGMRTLRITGALGWESVPGDIESIALNAVVRHWKAKSTGQSEVIGAAEFGGRLLRFIAPEERDKLDEYRVRTVG